MCGAIRDSSPIVKFDIAPATAPRGGTPAGRERELFDINARENPRERPNMKLCVVIRIGILALLVGTTSAPAGAQQPTIFAREP